MRLPFIAFIVAVSNNLKKFICWIFQVIRIRTLSENTNIAALAREIIDKCRLIHPTKLPEVEQLLYYLQNRKDAPASSTAGLCQ